MPQPRKIALFGGTFDPVHLGHLHLATVAKDSLGLDEVRFLPCQLSPHKLGSRPASASDRCKMLRLATADLPWAVVDDCEIHREGPSYSYQTAEAMAARFPDAQLYWIMGSDQWATLPNWKHPEILAAICEIIVLARGDFAQPLPNLENEWAGRPRSLRVHHLDTNEHPAAASKIRNALLQNQAPPAWLHPAVASWIEERQLYR